jgi:uncharacterized membrane protein
MRKYFITGLLVLVPLAITAWVLNLVIGTLDQSLLLVPKRWQPSTHIPGLGAIITLAIVFLTGLLTNNLVGKWFVRMWERLLHRIPVVNSIYGSVKQVSDTLFSSSGNAFRKAVLIPYPHENSYTIAFLTGVPGGDVANHLVGDYVSVYVPTTPNPTSGFFPDAGTQPGRRTGHERRRGFEVHRLDGRGGAAGQRAAAGRSARRRQLNKDKKQGNKNPWPAMSGPTESTNQDRKIMSSMRTHYCGLVTEELLGQTVSLCGWVHRRRDHGGVIFIDLRDREGLVQVVCHPDNADVFKGAEHVRNEYCLRITGTVVNRLEGTANANLKSGKIEINTTQLEVLNASVPVPFQLDDDNLSETTRLTHRVLDLRRNQMQHNLRLRYKVTMEVRKYLDNLGFIDIETPMLTKSTPEGARDYLVPSRVNPGNFFALPQSPQLFKQLLMVANFDRYYQITKCFRDEDLRADRQPEFTQIDCETSFLTEQEIRDLFEDMMRVVFKNAAGVDLPNPFPVMDFATAMGCTARTSRTCASSCSSPN